jgi:hypothetical protein
MGWLIEAILGALLIGAIIGLNGWVLLNPDGNKRSKPTPGSDD